MSVLVGLPQTYLKNWGQVFHKLHPCEVVAVGRHTCHFTLMCPSCKSAFQTGEWLNNPDLLKARVQRSLNGKRGRPLGDVTIRNRCYAVMKLQAAFGINHTCENSDGELVVSWHTHAGSRQSHRQYTFVEVSLFRSSSGAILHLV